MATLSANEFIVGPNAVPIIKHYPSSRLLIPVTLNSGNDITGYTLEADYQTIVVDRIAFDRAGDPNFTNSEVIGYFPKVEITGGDVPVINDAATGSVHLIIPADMYDGPLLPGDRTNVAVTYVSLTYINADGYKDSVRIPLLNSYEPDVDIGDPTTHTGYVAK